MLCHSKRSEESVFKTEQISPFARNDIKKYLRLLLTGAAFLFGEASAQTDNSYIARPQDTLKVLATDTAIKLNPDTIVASAIADSSNFHSPKKAAIMSAILPGLGQVYNKKYWKIPVIYAGFAVSGFFIAQKARNMRDYKLAYQYKTDNDSTTIDPFPFSTPEAILSAYNSYHRSRDLFVIVTAAVYVLNIVDATVDAHLFTFDVTDDLSFNFQPAFYTDNRYRLKPALSLTIKL